MNNINIEADSEGSSDLDLENFRASVSFPLEKLQQIVYNDQKYSNTILGFIRQGLKKIKRQELQYALVYFTQAEKILQYGASCGRTIDRNLIVCALHNEACCYQKLNELTKASKYIEAIIFNLKAHIRSIQSTPMNQNLFEPTTLLKTLPQLNRAPTKKKIELAHYFLQFCSISSQLKVRKTALQSAKNALQLYKIFFIDFKNQKRWESLAYVNHSDRQKMKNSLFDFKTFREDISSQQPDHFQTLAKYLVKKWKANFRQGNKTMIDIMLEGYSIGNFVQLEPLEYDEYDDKNNSQIEECESIIKELLHFSMGYFQIATEYRLIMEDKYKIDPGTKYSSQEFKLSKIYHLYSILFIALYIPYQILFMEQIISSYQHHYKISINDSLAQNTKVNLSIIFQSETKRTQSRKRKVSQIKAISKKKKNSAIGFNIKENLSSRVKQGSQQIAPSAKEQYFVHGTAQNILLRTKRNNSSQSRRSDKSEKKTKVNTQPVQTITITSGYKRQRMKTKVSEQPEKLIKRKQRAQDEYCGFALSNIKQRRESVQRYESRIEKGTRKNSCQNSAGKSPKFRKISYDKSTKKTMINYHKKSKEKEPKKMTMAPKSPKKPKLPQLKEKKKKTITITNYYL